MAGNSNTQLTNLSFHTILFLDVVNSSNSAVGARATECRKEELLSYFVLPLFPRGVGPDRLRKTHGGQGCGGLGLPACSLRLFSLPLVSDGVPKRFSCYISPSRN